MTEATACSTRRAASGSAAGSAPSCRRTAASSPMRAPRSMPALTVRSPTASLLPGESGSARSSGQASTTSLRRGVSIRVVAGRCAGYGYQDLGPKDMDGDPIGGRGLAEFALETRIRLKQLGGNFGIVPFLDGGIARAPRRFPTSRTGASPSASARAITRASGQSASMSASRSTARRATARSRSPSPSARPSSAWRKAASRR